MTTCRCHLPIESPWGLKWWQPTMDLDPGPGVKVIVRHGEDPEMRRAVRVDAGWIEEGVMVNFYQDRTPPMPWSRVGTCWAERPHAVVAVRQDADGKWVPEV